MHVGVGVEEISRERHSGQEWCGSEDVIVDLETKFRRDSEEVRSVGFVDLGVG